MPANEAAATCDENRWIFWRRERRSLLLWLIGLKCRSRKNALALGDDIRAEQAVEARIRVPVDRFVEPIDAARNAFNERVCRGRLSQRAHCRVKKVHAGIETELPCDMHRCSD